jgi:hypothetical protein
MAGWLSAPLNQFGGGFNYDSSPNYSTMPYSPHSFNMMAPQAPQYGYMPGANQYGYTPGGLTQPGFAPGQSIMPPTTKMFPNASGMAMDPQNGYAVNMPIPTGTPGTPPVVNPDQPNQTLGNINMGIQGAKGLLDLGMGIYGMYQAGQQFDFQKSVTEENLAAQRHQYNSSREDRIRGGYSKAYTAAHQGEIDAQVAKSQLPAKKTK